MTGTSTRAALALLVAGVSSTLVLMTLPVFVGAIANGFGMSDREAGWLASADMTGSAIASLCIIPLIGRVRWRGLACVAIVAAVAGNALSMIANTLPAILAARFLAGAGGGLVLSLAFVGLCRSAAPDRYFGIYVFLQLSMQAFALMAFPVVLARFGLDAVFIVFAIVATASAALVPLFPARMPPAHATAGTRSSQGNMYVSGGAALGLLAQAIYFLAPGAVWGYLERIGQGFSLSLSQVAHALSVSTVAGIAAAVLVMVIGSRVPRGRALLVGSVLSIVAVTLLIEGTGLVRFMVASSLFNFAWNATFPYQMGVLASLDRTGAVAVLSLLTQLAALALGPLLASTLLSTSGYDGILLACIACYVVSLFGFTASTRLP